jgi:murein DD-endopeptidase MepM/ murein hydrolase activator NlpD
VSRKFALTLSVILVIALVFLPYSGQASSQLDKINQEIKRLQNEIANKKKEQAAAEKRVNSLMSKKEATKEEINKLMVEIDQTGVKLAQTQQKLAETEEQLQLTQQALEEARAQEKETSGKLDARLRLMYTNGTVSYLDVLLSSTSFADFISRFDAFQSVAVQTRELLNNQKSAREMVEFREAQIEKDKLEIELLYAEIDQYLQDLKRQEQEKINLVAQLNEEIEHEVEISEEAERLLMELAAKMSKAEAEKNRLVSYYNGGKFYMPLQVSYRLTSDFGTRVHPITGKTHTHSGIDMAVKQGTPIYAAESGVVIVAQWWSSYGNCIIIDHGGGLWTVYGHIMTDGILVKKGQTVKRGDKIALVGSTGQSTGPHLHFEVRKNEKPVDPKPYLK